MFKMKFNFLPPYILDSGRSTLMESNYYPRDLQEELSNASSINAPYHSAKTVLLSCKLKQLPFDTS